DLEQLLRLSDELPEATARDARNTVSARRQLALEAAPEERMLLLERAAALAQPLEQDGFTGLTPVAVARLGAEFLGFELDWVLEFAAVRTVTPVPCCPPQIAGQVNLRGDIVTLVDLRPILWASLRSAHATRDAGRATETEVASRESRVARASEARFLVLVEIDALRFGVLVDEVLEIVPLHAAQIGA